MNSKNTAVAPSVPTDCSSAWTNNKPTEAGVYWLRLLSGDDAGDHLVAMKKIIHAGGDAYLLCEQVLCGSIDTRWSIAAEAVPANPSDRDYDELQADSWWSGPLSPPE